MCRIVSQLLILFMMLIGTPVETFSTDTETYFIEEIGMSVELPDDFEVITRDIDEDSYILDMLDFTYSELIDFLEYRNMYLNAFPIPADYEVIINMTRVDIEDFASCDDEFLEMAAEEMLTLDTSEFINDSEISITEVAFYEYEIYTTEQAKYIFLSGSSVQYGEEVFSCQYYTVIDGMAVNIILHSYSGEFTDENKELLKSIVDSAVYEANAAPSTEDLWSFEDDEENVGDNDPAETESPDDEDTVEVQAGADAAFDDDASSSDEGAEIAALSIMTSLFASAGSMLLGILMAFLIYMLPIIIYRYGIRKAPVSGRKAMLISVIYGAAATALLVIPFMVFVSAAVNLAPVIIGCIGNYHMLKNGKANTDAGRTVTITAAAPVGVMASAPSVPSVNNTAVNASVCPNCGNKLIEDSLFCNKCGTRIKG